MSRQLYIISYTASNNEILHSLYGNYLAIYLDCEGRQHKSLAAHKLLICIPTSPSIYLFIYYKFLSKTRVTQKAKPVQGASPQKLHTTYKLHTQDQTN